MNKTNSITFKKDTQRMAAIRACIMVFTFAFIQGSIMGDVFTIWLKSNIKLDTQQIGELFAFKAMFAIFYKPIFGYLLDKFQLKKTFIIIIPILGMLMGPFFQYVYAPLITNPNTFYLGGILGGAFFGFVIIAGGAAVMNYADRYIRAHGGTSGIMTAFFVAGVGTVGFLGSRIYEINPIFNFYLSSIAGIILVITIVSLRTKIFYHVDTKIIPKKTIQIIDIFNLFKNIDFWVLLSFVIFCTAIQWVSNAQLGSYSLTFWDSKKDAVDFMGDLAIPFSLMSFITLIFASRVIKRIGENRSIILVHCIAILFFMVIATAGFVHLKSVYVGARFIGGFSNSLFNVVILTYVACRFEQRVNGVAFLLGFHFINNFTMLLVSSELGKIFKEFGFAQGYVYLAIISGLGLVVTLILMHFAHIKKDKQAII